MIRRGLRAVTIPIVAGFVLVVAGCDESVPQQVLVDVAAWKGAPEVLRLHETAECKGPFQEQTRSAEMAFKFETVSTRGGVGVVTQDLALCYLAGSGWRSVWSSRHGGGAIRIVLRCDSSTSCTDEFFYR